MTNHKNCGHPLTATARAACRKLRATTPAPTTSPLFVRPGMANTVHCEMCGRIDPGTDDGYTGCCNEPVCYGDHIDVWNVGTPGDNYNHGVTGTITTCCSGAVGGEVPGGIVVLGRTN